MASTTTVQDILTDALVDCGAFNVGEPPPADAINKALRMFNWLLSQWNRKRYLIYHLQDDFCTADGSKLFYTVGPGGDIDMSSRPDLINAAYMRQLNASPDTPVDYQLKLLTAYEDYSRISIKTLKTWSQWLFYDPAYPLGKAYPWPVMQTGFELHIVRKAILERYDTISELLGVPEEYEMAFYCIMKVRLGATYRLPPNPIDVGLAKEALNVIRGANSQIATMAMPRAIRSNRNKYNIYSDNN